MGVQEKARGTKPTADRPRLQDKHGKLGIAAVRAAVQAKNRNFGGRSRDAEPRRESAKVSD